MNNYETFNANGFEEAAETRWYSYTPRKSRICDVLFNDALEIGIPMDGFYDDLTEFAKGIGSIPCYEALTQRRKQA